VHQAILIAPPQQLDSLVIGDLPGHPMLDTPPAGIAQEKTRFQQVVAVMAGGSYPVWQAAGTVGDTPVACLLHHLGDVLRGLGVFG